MARIFLVLFLCVSSTIAVKANNFPSGGDGTASNPFQITTVDELAALATLVNANTANYRSAHYILMNDIDLDIAPHNQGAGWTTIGTGGQPFLGVFDGNGNTISGLFINQTGTNKGLFGVVQGNAVIRNLHVAGSVTNTQTSAGWNECVGGITGRLQGNASLQNSSFSGSVTGVRTSIGGLVGLLYNTATITNSWSDATVRNTTNGNQGRLGGLVGAMEGNSVVSNSFFSGTVIGAGERTGGIAGHMNGAGTRISNCFVTGEVRGNQWSTGGIVGFIMSAGIIENNYVTGLISEGSSIRLGGILGRASAANLAVTIRNNIVLSPSIRGNGGNQARIHGDPVTVNAPFTYSNNFAWDGITNFAGNTNWGVTAANNRNGANISAIEIHEADFFETLFASAPAGTWTFAPGKLPGLNGEAVEMPQHLRVIINPDIIAHPQSATYNQNDTASALTITAIFPITTISPNGGTLAFQWYSCTTHAGAGTRIEGATDTSFIPPTTTVGTIYYFVRVHSLYTDLIGATVSGVIESNRASITVLPIVDAQAPNITAHPQSATYNHNVAASALTVTATSPDGGTLTYQWYSNTVNSNTGGTRIDGAIGASHTPSTATVGTVYYYVVITNTNNSVNGTRTATSTSNTAAITVTEPKETGIGNTLSANLQIFPNPFTNTVNITGAENSSLQVLNILGTIVYTRQITSTDETIHLGIPAGAYLFRVERDGQTRTVKVVKR